MGNRLTKTRHDIRRVAVLGAGTMGARIAAHVANAGFPVLLLDVPDNGGGSADGVAQRALSTLRKSRPAALVDDDVTKRIETGNFRDDLARLATCDWVIEAVVERLDIKQDLLRTVLPHLHSRALLTSNTSGIPLRQIAEGFPQDMRRRWMGTHFFNPPRYMALFELIGGDETDPEALAAITQFAETRLGKTVVKARDTPNFIANRIGVFAMLDVMKIAIEQGLSIEEVDVLTGSPIGWPKTATFRLADLVGIDVVAHVARNFSRLESDERADVTLPEYVERMLAEGRLGDKAGKGFYAKGVDRARPERLVLDPQTLGYVATTEANFPELTALKGAKSTSERYAILLASPVGSSRAAKFYWEFLTDLWMYSANRLEDASDSVLDIDAAMTAGFNWQLGPFAMWDAAGVENTVVAMRKAGKPLPHAVEVLLASGGTSWYSADGEEYFDIRQRMYLPKPRSSRELSLRPLCRLGVLSGNGSVSLIDLGKGIACFELHSKMNTLGSESARFFQDLLSPAGTPEDVQGFVIATEADYFSLGANLTELLGLIETKNWKGLEEFLLAFQSMTRAVKFAAKPVVAAISGLCLGGGAELAMHAASRVAHIELSMGLVETGVGLIPGGGGCKEMVLHALDAGAPAGLALPGANVNMLRELSSSFETLATAKTSSSAVEARRLHLLRAGDGITMNRRHLLMNARRRALSLVESDYRAPQPVASLPAPGRSALATLRNRIFQLSEGQFMSDYDSLVANKLAFVLCGGDVLDDTEITEEELLGLERNAFLSLCGEQKTQDRIAYTLKSGKPLRN